MSESVHIFLKKQKNKQKKQKTKQKQNKQKTTKQQKQQKTCVNQAECFNIFTYRYTPALQ